MSLDAQVKDVYACDGSGRLYLVDRPGNPPGIAGQCYLVFDESPEEVASLKGLNIWGSSGSVMLGEVEIAKRDGYTKIVFHDRETFCHAVREYHAKHKVQ